MRLVDFINNLQKLVELGEGDAQVYYRHGASGDCGKLSSAFISANVDECGPFDLQDDEKYISIYAGN